MSAVASKPNVIYDGRHDILYLLIDAPKPSLYYEDVPGIAIRRAASNDRITGATIMEFSKQSVSYLRRQVPIDIDWEAIFREHVNR